MALSTSLGVMKRLSVVAGAAQSGAPANIQFLTVSICGSGSGGPPSGISCPPSPSSRLYSLEASGFPGTTEPFGMIRVRCAQLGVSLYRHRQVRGR